jgi:hypothetical protein
VCDCAAHSATQRALAGSRRAVSCLALLLPWPLTLFSDVMLKQGATAVRTAWAGWEAAARANDAKRDGSGPQRGGRRREARARHQQRLHPVQADRSCMLETRPLTRSVPCGRDRLRR